MMTGFLLAYVCLTLPLFAWGFWRVYQQRHPKEEKLTPAQMSELEKMVQETFGKKGITVKVHEVPRTPTEAIMVAANSILAAIRESDKVSLAWFQFLRKEMETSKRDVGAVMQSVEAIGKMLLEEPTIPAPEVSGSVESFVHNLEYVRDRYAKTKPQKTALETIINIIKTDHAAK